MGSACSTLDHNVFQKYKLNKQQRVQLSNIMFDNDREHKISEWVKLYNYSDAQVNHLILNLNQLLSYMLLIKTDSDKRKILNITFDRNFETFLGFHFLAPFVQCIRISQCPNFNGLHSAETRGFKTIEIWDNENQELSNFINLDIHRNLHYRFLGWGADEYHEMKKKKAHNLRDDHILKQKKSEFSPKKEKRCSSRIFQQENNSKKQLVKCASLTLFKQK